MLGIKLRRPKPFTIIFFTFSINSLFMVYQNFIRINSNALFYCFVIDYLFYWANFIGLMIFLLCVTSIMDLIN